MAGTGSGGGGMINNLKSVDAQDQEYKDAQDEHDAMIAQNKKLQNDTLAALRGGSQGYSSGKDSLGG